MAALTDNDVFKNLVNTSDDKIVAGLTDTNKRGKLEISITYTASAEGGVGGIVITKTFNAIESIVDTSVSSTTL